MKAAYLKKLKVGGYIILMVISTWATVESARRLLVGWPVAILWILSSIFFSLASLGAKLLVESLDKTVRRNGRIYLLAGGLFLLFLFWTAVILPTNTHTFFYKSVIAQTTLEELAKAETDLTNFNVQGEKTIADEQADFEQKVLREISNFSNEILNVGDQGSGVRAETILVRIESLLGSDVHIYRPTLKSKKQADLIAYARQVETAIKQQLVTKSKIIYDRRKEDLKSNLDKGKINYLVTKLANEKAYVEKFHEPRSETRNLVIECYAMIDRYSDRLNGKDGDSKSIVNQSRIPKIIELENVIQVWKNFFRGSYKNMGFGYWITIAALIDVAGFIFFFLGFKQNNEY